MQAAAAQRYLEGKGRAGLASPAGTAREPAFLEAGPAPAPRNPAAPCCCGKHDPAPTADQPPRPCMLGPPLSRQAPLPPAALQLQGPSGLPGKPGVGLRFLHPPLSFRSREPRPGPPRPAPERGRSLVSKRGCHIWGLPPAH
jgi:hypothetical protein